MKVADSSRRSFRRRAVQVEVRMIFRPPVSFASSVGAERLTLVGRTRNLSETGLAMVVSARNIDRYLKAKDPTIDLELQMPDGSIALQATPIYFKKTVAGSGATYLIGARFIHAKSQDRDRLNTFLRALPPTS